jgi:hypothetical protein
MEQKRQQRWELERKWAEQCRNKKDETKQKKVAMIDIKSGDT